MEERTQGMHESVAAVSHRLQAPMTWLGPEDVNVLKILCDLLMLVEKINTQIALHKHGATSFPDSAVSFETRAGEAVGMNLLLNKVAQQV